MDVIQSFAVALLLLLLGDFVATFGYHVPEHVFGKYHMVIHHSPNRSFILYALRHRKPIVLLAGFCSALPYLIFVPWLWQLSPAGTVMGLGLAELHVLWRHQSHPSYRTPSPIQAVCRWLCITTPERHQLHHQNALAAYGDVFTFYGQPALWWLAGLTWLKRQGNRVMGGR